MRELCVWLRDEENHQDTSMVVIVIISHGDSQGNIKSVEGNGISIYHLIGTLNDVKTLVGKPKAIFVNACRGGKGWFFFCRT